MKKLCFICLISLGFIGCSDFLDKTDPTATSFDEFFNDEDDLRRVVYSSFTDVWTNSGNRRMLFYMLDGRSDNAYARLEGDHHQLIANGNISSNTPAFEYYYALHMKHLGRLNTFIANADIPYVENEAARTKYVNNLEALRIWHYFQLVFRWGDVPFYLKPATIADATQPATPGEEILDIIFPLALEIAEELPEEEYSSDKFMFNQYSLKALVMRYALYFERYQLAADLAKEIMDSGRYSLHPNYADLFQYDADDSNNEFIMVQDMSSHSGGTYSFRDMGPHYRTGPGQSYVVPLKSLVDSYWTLQGRSIEDDEMYSKAEYEVNPNLNRDPRYEASIMGQGDVFYEDIIDVYNANSPMFYELDRASASGYWFKKFVDEDDAFKPSNGGSMEYPLLRYAEVLLTFAEAKLMLNQFGAEAKAAINQVRERAGLDMTQADVTSAYYASFTHDDWVDLVRNERRIELAAEGLRYDDIIRWRIAEEVLNGPVWGDTRMVDGELQSLFVEERTFQPHNYLWPFHESTLKVEPGLTQNPGY